MEFSEGPVSPRCGCVFLVLNVFGVGFVHLLSQKKKKKTLEFELIYNEIMILMMFILLRGLGGLTLH